MTEIAPAYVLPVRVGLVGGGTRRQGWRATLQSGERVVWRCACRPHATYDIAYRCGASALSERQSHSKQQQRTDRMTAVLSKGDK